ncbi:hypothetical protein N302_03516, partial [Corvus brachyrhynchos]
FLLRKERRAGISRGRVGMCSKSVPLSPELVSLPDADKRQDLLYKSSAPEAFTRTVMFTLKDSNSSALVSRVALTSLRNLKLHGRKL